jgi:hypothetical protein
MCWNAEVSLNTFIFGMISMIIVIIFNKISYNIILFTLTLTLIQLLEYYTWKNIDNIDIIYNLSIIGYLIISIQLIILNYTLLNNNDKPVALIILIILIIYIFIYNYQNNKFNMEIGENKHLIWHWIDIPLPILIIIMVLYIYPAFRYNYISFAVMVIILLPSLYYYYKYKTWGTMWCYYSNIIWIILIILSISLQNKKILRKINRS